MKDMYKYDGFMPEGIYKAKITDIMYVESDVKEYRFSMLLLTTTKREINIRIYANRLKRALTKLSYMDFDNEIDLCHHIGKTVIMYLTVKTNKSGRKYYTFDWYIPICDINNWRLHYGNK